MGTENANTDQILKPQQQNIPLDPLYPETYSKVSVAQLLPETNDLFLSSELVLVS